MAVFPGAGANSLGVKVELLSIVSAGVWSDITQFVRLRNPITISGMGRADWTSTLQAASLTLTLANDGRFTPKLAAGAYFPNITRNVQIRVSVNATSVTAVAYSGFRFWGEVAEWPPKWSTSGRDVYVDITANGIWRRMSQLATSLGSAFQRYNSITLTGTSQPRAYWPMEDGTGSGQLVSVDSTAGTANAVQSFVTGQAGLSLAACTDFKGSDGIPQLNAAKITATVPAGGTATNNVTRFLISVPAAGDSASGTTNWNVAEINSAGTIAKFEVYLNATGTLLVQLRNSGGTVVASGTTTTNVKGKPVLASCELTPSGGNVAFAFRIITPGAAGITESLTGTVTTASVGAVSTVVCGRANVLMDTAVGHLSVTYGAVPLMVPAAYALGGYTGEFAMDRFTRICGEMGIAAETIGTASATAAMGPQIDDTLTNVLQSVEDTDLGLLFESRTQFGLGYRSLTSMANQSAAATISYTAARIDPSLSTAFDDSLTRNNVTVTNQSSGYTQQAILTVGAMSILNPPSGIGNGYAYQRTVNAAADSQIAGIANWLLNVGSVDEIRFPVITIKMVRAENASLFAAIPGLRPGDYVQITNPPSFLTASTVKQLAVGYTETLSGTPREWTFSFNAVPESPYETGFSAGTVQTAQLPGSGAVTSTAPGAGGLGGLLQNGSITPSMLNQGITVKTLGGNLTTISASAPSTPNTNDIWIASATGLISQWNGTSWVPFKFDASATIQAATIVASNIAASTITASLLAAGIVVAGIVDATTVEAAEYIATSAQGEFLAYDVSSPTTGHLVNSIAGSAGTDSASNPYPKGLYSQQLTLASQSGAPTGVSGSSVLYTSSGGRLRYLSSTGNDLVLDRSVLDLTTHSMGTQTAAQVMSSSISYLANEAQAGSEYEIEIDGTITTPSSTTTSLPTYNFSFFIDGSGTGINNVTIGAVMLSAGLTMAYTLRVRLTLNTTGAGGSGNVAFDGGMVVQLNGATQFNLGNPSPTTAHGGGGQGSVAMNQITTGVAFDSTANHTLDIRGNWGTSSGTSLTQSAITYRTKKTRRN
ncbi:MAG TPA: hypothetical protein VGL33_30395 [Streptosporangiaceae bacterium]